MSDFAPQRGGHPIKPVVTVAELLGRHAGTLSDGAGGPVVARTAVSVSSLLRREGQASDLASGLTAPRRRLATSVGAVLAVSSLAGAAIMLGHSEPGSASAGALDGGYPESNLLDPTSGSSRNGGQNAAGGIPLALKSTALPLPAVAESDLPPAFTPPGPSLSPTPPAATRPGPAPTGLPTSRPNGLVSGITSSVGTLANAGGGALGNTVASVGRVLPGPVSGPVQSVGRSLSSTTRTVSDVLDHSVGGVVASSPAGSALSSLTKSITTADARSSGTGRSLGEQDAAKAGNQDSVGSLAEGLIGSLGRGSSFSSGNHNTGGLVSPVLRSNDGSSGNRSGGGSGRSSGGRSSGDRSGGLVSSVSSGLLGH